MTRKKGKNGEAGTAWAMVLPAFLLIFGLGLFPMLYAISLSMRDINPILLTGEFVGLKNYREIFGNRDFWSSIGLTLYFTAASILLQVGLGILVSMLLHQKFRGRWLVRALVLVPWTVPTIVNANAWLWILNANYGVLNRVLVRLGIVERGIAWLSDARLALNMIVLADTWRMLPLVVIMLLAALQTVPGSLLDAAVVDGAGALRRFQHVYLPCMKPMLLVVLVLRTMQALRVFDIVYVLTRGGPANGTMVISFYSYFETFNYMNYGKGSAIAIVISLLTLAISLVYLRVFRTDD